MNLPINSPRSNLTLNLLPTPNLKKKCRKLLKPSTVACMQEPYAEKPVEFMLCNEET